jgi:hypothetical protein
MTFIKIRSHRRKFSNSDNVEPKITIFSSLYYFMIGQFKMIVYKMMWQLREWGRVDICMIFHRRAFDFFIPLHIYLTIFKIARL